MLKKSMALVLIAVVIMSLTGSVFADKTTGDKAVDLNQLNLLKGDGSDYNLDGQLKRSEAATFIVRLLGKENEVLSNKTKYVKTGFADVAEDAWYAPYIGYCAQNKIVNGVGDGTYRPNDFVSEKAFVKMALGAMGYVQDTDFAWASVYKYGYEKGLLTSAEYAVKETDNTNYLRSSVIEVLYNSLDKRLKDQPKTIVQRLIDNGITTTEKATSIGVIKEDKLKTAISAVETISATEIKFSFNENLKDFKLTQIDVYDKVDTSKKLDVSEVLLKDNTLTIKTTATEATKEYVAYLINVEDTQGAVIETLSATFKGYEEKEITSAYFKIAKIEAVSKSQVNVYFTHPVTNNTEIPLFYSIWKDGQMYIDGSFKTMQISTMGEVNNGISIWLKDKDLMNDQNYTLKIKGDMYSKYNVKLNEGDGESKDFIGKGSENEALLITGVQAISDKVVRVTFNKDIDKGEATTLSNFTLKDKKLGAVHSPVKVLMNGIDSMKKRQIDVFWPLIYKDREYEMTVKNMKDSFKASEITTEVLPFFGYQADNGELRLDYAVALDNSKIAVYFNKPLDSTSTSAAVTIAGVTKQSVTIDEEKPYIMTIYLSSGTLMDSSKSYKLQFLTGIKDTSGLAQTKTLEYEVVGNSALATQNRIINAQFISKETVLIEFEGDIHNAINNATSKYTLEYKESDTTKTLNASSAGFIDKRRMIVTFSGASGANTYTLKCSNIVDFSGQFTTLNISSSVERE